MRVRGRRERDKGGTIGGVGRREGEGGGGEERGRERERHRKGYREEERVERKEKEREKARVVAQSWRISCRERRRKGGKLLKNLS